MSKNRKVILALVSALILSIGLGSIAYATSAYNIASMGRLEYDKDKDGVFEEGEDVLFDAEDLTTIENQIITGKTKVITALNNLDKNNVIADLSTDPAVSTYDVIANYISNSQASTSVPTAAQILTGKEVWANGLKITGTMPDNGSTGTTGLAAGKSYTIPAGYTSGGTVTTATLKSQTSANAAAGNILKDKTAWVNGTKITGTMANNGATGTTNLAAGKSYTIPAGYTSGGTVTTATLKSQTSANAAAANILKDKTAWVNGAKVTGTMANNGTTGKTGLTAGQSYTIPAGYTSGGTVTAATLASQTSATATAANLSSGVTAWVNGTKITGTGADNNSYYTQGQAAPSIKNGTYTWTWDGNSFSGGSLSLTDTSLSYNTGKSNLIAAVITKMSGVYFYDYNSAPNSNEYAPVSILTSVDSDGNIYIEIPAGYKMTNYYDTDTNDYGTATITITYYYY